MALKLSAEDVAKLQDKQLANVIRKLNSGKTLTAKEEALLAQARSGPDGQNGSPSDAASGYAKNWDDLATALRIERRTLFNFRQRFAIEIKRRGSTLTRADGRHAIAAWSALLDECGLQRRGVNAQLAGDDGTEGTDGLPTMEQLKKRELKIRLDREEFKLAKEKEEMLEVGKFEQALGAMLSQFRQSLDALPSRCAGLLGDLDVRNQARELIREMMARLRSAKTEDDAMQIAELHIVRLLPEPDYHFRLLTIQKEVEITKRNLRECRYLEAAQPTLSEGAAAAATAEQEAGESDDDGPEAEG